MEMATGMLASSPPVGSTMVRVPTPRKLCRRSHTPIPRVGKDTARRYLPAREMSMDAEYYESEDDSDVESLVDRERAVSKIRSMSECAMERMEV
jgi:hypothetical protein